MKMNLFKVMDVKKAKMIPIIQGLSKDELKEVIKPFLSLNPTIVYSAIFHIIEKDNNEYEYSTIGGPKQLYNKLMMKIFDVNEIYLVILDKNQTKGKWFNNKGFKNRVYWFCNTRYLGDFLDKLCSGGI